MHAREMKLNNRPYPPNPNEPQTHPIPPTHNTQIVFGLAVLYPLAGPLLYTYMFKQRTKRLGGGGGKAKVSRAVCMF